jgi:mono/diheme cytochrome c family protein
VDSQVHRDECLRRHRRSFRAFRAAFQALVGCVALVAACGDGPRRGEAMAQVTGGDARLGRQLVRTYGCVDCHTIPGVRGADALVGPPLTNWSRRVYIAGLVPNTPDNLVLWIHDPHRIHARSAMPNMGVNVEHAAHIAAYLYTIR